MSAPRTFIVAFTATDADLPGLIADNIRAGRTIERIGVADEIPYSKNRPLLKAPKKARKMQSTRKQSVERENVILDALKNGPKKGAELIQVFMSHGFAEGGFWQARRRLVNRGLVKPTGKKPNQTWAIGG